MAHDGLARSINPVHTMGDGDIVFALAHRRERPARAHRRCSARSPPTCSPMRCCAPSAPPRRIGGPGLPTCRRRAISAQRPDERPGDTRMNLTARLTRRRAAARRRAPPARPAARRLRDPARPRRHAADRLRARQRRHRRALDDDDLALRDRTAGRASGCTRSTCPTRSRATTTTRSSPAAARPPSTWPISPPR